MKKIYYFTLIFLLVFSGKTIAQSSLSFSPGGSGGFNIIAPPPGPTPITTLTSNYLPLSNYHFFNPFYHNPAMAGIEGKKQFITDWNRQLDHSFSLSYEQPISSINSTFGMQYSYTSNFSHAARHYGLAYNYGFKLSDSTQLKLGIQFSQTSIALNEMLFGFDENKEKWYNAPSMDIGLAYQAKQLRIGMSVQNLFPSKIISADTISNFYNVIIGERQFNLSLAHTFKTAEEWAWSIAILLRKTEAQNINDFSSYFSYRKKYFFGATYRTDVDNYWIAFVGVKIKDKLNLQFSFNTQKDDLEDRRFFEALIQYQFKK